MTMSDEIKEKTKKTAELLFHGVDTSEGGYTLWRQFDKELAKEISMFFTGRLYSREVLSQKQRELCAVAALTALNRQEELRLHIHAARNVGATREEIAEVIFQMLVYGGAPVMVEGLKVAKRALQERGEWKE
jgi:alkylhydroperoxidase/carboxymuconolactone decarboxylase family protein YurZ